MALADRHELQRRHAGYLHQRRHRLPSDGTAGQRALPVGNHVAGAIVHQELKGGHASAEAHQLHIQQADKGDEQGTLIGTAKNAGMTDKNGNLPGGDRALIADAIATCCGACLGTRCWSGYTSG